VSTVTEYDWETFLLVVALHVSRSVQVSGRLWPQGGHNFSATERRAPLLDGADPLLGIQPEVAVGNHAGCLLEHRLGLLDQEAAELEELVEEQDTVVPQRSGMFPEKSGLEAQVGLSERSPPGSGSTQGTHGPSTITASSSPGQGGRAVTVQTRATLPVQRY
jgi:hypothetical protein